MKKTHTYCNFRIYEYYRVRTCRPYNFLQDSGGVRESRGFAGNSGSIASQVITRFRFSEAVYSFRNDVLHTLRSEIITALTVNSGHRSSLHDNNANE